MATHRPSELRVWTATLRLHNVLPEKVALKELLYGDPNNTAHDADVIALFIMDLHVPEEQKRNMEACLCCPEVT